MSDLDNDVDNSTELDETNTTEEVASLDDILSANYDKATGGAEVPDASLAPTNGTEVVDKTAPVVNQTVDVYTKYGIKKHVGHDGKEYPIDLANAPAAVKKEIKDIWAQLPEPVRAEFYRREGDFHEGLGKYTTAANYAIEVSENFKPYQAMLNASGYSNHSQFVKESLGIMNNLLNGPMEGRVQQWLAIAQAYGIDMDVVSKIQERINTGQPAVDPTVAALQAELQSIKTSMSSQQAEKQRAEYEASKNDIVSFEADPKNEFIKDTRVRARMATQLKTGQALNLRDAYDNAILLEPEIRDKVIAKQLEQRQKEAADKAAAAKKASTTTVKTKGKTSGSSKKGGSDIDKLLNERLDELNYKH